MLLKKKSFVHWYTTNGMDEMTFDEAQNIITDIAGQYYRCTQGYYENFEDYEEGFDQE